ncbi:MAG TPA: hypothetical protein VFS20_15615 [Longimicrobium sp.]|nr:hypothetical protein [Longimicrobium sp.]
MGDEIMAGADGRDGALAAGGEARNAGSEREGWRRGFLDSENWHDLAERGTPRNG